MSESLVGVSLSRRFRLAWTPSPTEISAIPSADGDLGMLKGLGMITAEQHDKCLGSEADAKTMVSAQGITTDPQKDTKAGYSATEAPKAA